ncbi:MAG: hypothetical protein GQ582_05535 [Methyloprofundus sp.]|nr:hypothetical protein [Methyloprofundus sp.]
MLTDKHNLIVPAARYHDLVYFCVRNKEGDEEGDAHSLFNGYYQGELGHAGNCASWDTVAMAVARKPEEMLIATSVEGQVFSFVGGVEAAEQIPITRGDIRNLTTVEGFVYACGVKRQVFRRDSANTWVDISAAAPSSGEERMIGFEAIHGFSKNELYAAGWSGEIYKYDGEQWLDVISPCNTILTAVSCGEDGVVYIVGKDGILIKGRDMAWEVVDTEGIVDDFWDVHWFKGKAYISSLSRLYEYDGTTFQIVDTGEEQPDSCFKLSSAEGVMWSLGIKDLFKFDGETWEKIIL